MGAEQSLIGGRKRSRSVDSNGNKTFEAYEAVRKMLKEQGKDFKEQVFLDLPDARVLKRLGIFEDCDIGRFDDKECKNSIKNIVIKAHGSLKKHGLEHVTIPENIVVLFMGELGHITWSSHYKNMSKEICNKELVPNQIGLPGSIIPNVGLQAEHQENHTYSTGIYDCDLEKNNILNQFEGFEHYLIPTKEKVIKNMKPEVQEMLEKAEKKAKKEGKEIIKRVTLNDILPKISEKIPKDKYGFVYITSCLGVCQWKTKDEIELYTKPTGLSLVRGYTVKKIPARLDVSRYSLGDGKKWNPVLTNDKDIITARNWFVNAYDDKRNDKTFINEFVKHAAFNFDKNWRQHLPDINSYSIQNNESKLRKSAVVNHFKFIDLLHEGDLEKIKNAWNMQFEDKTEFLLPLINYIIYSKKRNLGEEIIDLIVNFEDNKKIFENIYEIEFENPENEIRNLIKDKNLEDLKKLMFQYMKNAVDGDEEFKNIEYQDIYDEENDDETIQKALNAVEAHEIYNYTILYADIPREDEYIIENKDKLKNALDIEPYLKYVNSSEFVHLEKDDVIKQMYKLRDLLGFPAIQQAGQYGGMWQRGGFFMTCS